MIELTPKQESFCLKYVECGNASEAYRHSYDCENMQPATVNRSAKELIDNPKITARIKKLQEGHVKRHQLTVDDLITELEENRKAALSAETVQSSAATAATMGKARLLGLDKQVVEQTGESALKITVSYE